jgi:hypothetical protein
MRRLLILTGLAVVGAALATADSYTGQLLDASCYAQAKSAKACAAAPSSSEFLLEASGKIYKLDPDGNAKAVEALKSRAGQPAPGTEASPVNAKVNGSMEGDILHVDTIALQ